MEHPTKISVSFAQWSERMEDISEVDLGLWLFILLKDMPYEKVEAITSMIRTFHLQQSKLKLDAPQ